MLPCDPTSIEANSVQATVAGGTGRGVGVGVGVGVAADVAAARLEVASALGLGAAGNAGAGVGAVGAPTHAARRTPRRRNAAWRFAFICHRRWVLRVEPSMRRLTRAIVSGRPSSVTPPWVTRARQSRSACRHAVRRQAGRSPSPRSRTSPGKCQRTRSSSSTDNPRPSRRRESSSAPSMSAWRSRLFRRSRRS